MSDRLPGSLRAYRLLSIAARPLAPLLLDARRRRGKELGTRLMERRGRAGCHRPDGALVWLHAASVGELASVLPLVERIAGSEVNVLVTTGTVTSSELAGQRLPAHVVHQFVPVDVPRYVRRFLDHWRPDLALFVESDLWPNRLIEASRRRVPIIIVNARLSEASFRRWRLLPGAIANLLHRVDLCLARTHGDAERFAALGAPRIVTAGDLKLDVPPPPCDGAKLAALHAAIGTRPVIAAASTHEGEEHAMTEAHLRLKARFPKLLTLIVPRHPERGSSVADLAFRKGLVACVRSRGQLPTPKTEIYVVDTVGELGLIYRLAPIVFVGGSLARHGGQNPIEPAKLGAAIVHGPNVWNFAEIYAALDRARGAERVDDTDRLVAELGALMADPALRQERADQARATVAGLGGALERTLQEIEPYLLQLRLVNHHA
ncbi:MAG: 3-deoxy-D-manno-octulosonic acid transferase [Pseudolabrys sp.]|nr:3-deoxy-D-manno-octulosonic acid transferase [Pseudolabrys sp.]